MWTKEPRRPDFRGEAYIRAVLSKVVSGDPSGSEILAPFRDQVAESGISDVELDCMVFLQGAARRESAAGECLHLAESDATELYVSHEIMTQVRNVLARPRVRQKFPVLTVEPYINLAIAAGAKYLVSRDNDILDLARTAAPDGERLRNCAPELQILEPAAFVAEIRQRLRVPSAIEHRRAASLGQVTSPA